MRSRLPRPQAIRRHEVAFGRRLARLLVDPARASFEQRILPLVVHLAALRDEGQRADAIDDDDLRRAVDRALDEASAAHQATITPEATEAARVAFRAADKTTARTTRAQIAKAASDAAGRKATGARARRALGLEVGPVALDPLGSEPWLETATRRAVTDSLGKIHWATDQTYQRAKRQILDDLRAGVRVEVIAERLSDNLGIASRRARAIARNELGNFTGEITKRRHEDLGVDSYTWRTSGDERVRGPGGKYPHAYPSHRAREGKVYRWDDPPKQSPDDGHPGQPHGCRCTAEPVFEVLAPKKRRRKRR